MSWQLSYYVLDLTRTTYPSLAFPPLPFLPPSTSTPLASTGYPFLSFPLSPFPQSVQANPLLPSLLFPSLLCPSFPPVQGPGWLCSADGLPLQAGGLSCFNMSEDHVGVKVNFCGKSSLIVNLKLLFLYIFVYLYIRVNLFNV